MLENSGVMVDRAVELALRRADIPSRWPPATRASAAAPPSRKRSSFMPPGTHVPTSQPVPVPEPVARKGPKNVTSSGVSFRDDDLPLPSLEELVKIVDHYENKASGQYVEPADTPVPTIGRYLFEMCSEMSKMAIGLQGVREAQDERIRCASRLAPPPPPRAPD